MRRVCPKEIEQYIRDHQGKIYRLVYSYVLNESDALEIVQKSIINVLTRCKKVRDKGTLNISFMAVLRSNCWAYRRDKAVISEDQRKDSLKDWEILRYLTMEKREVVVLKFFEGLSLNEIQSLLNSNRNVIKLRLHNTLEKLERGDYSLEKWMNEARKDYEKIKLPESLRYVVEKSIVASQLQRKEQSGLIFKRKMVVVLIACIIFLSGVTVGVNTSQQFASAVEKVPGLRVLAKLINL